jgi:hypothetical protein
MFKKWSACCNIFNKKSKKVRLNCPCCKKDFSAICRKNSTSPLKIKCKKCSNKINHHICNYCGKDTYFSGGAIIQFVCLACNRHTYINEIHNSTVTSPTKGSPKEFGSVIVSSVLNSPNSVVPRYEELARKESVFLYNFDYDTSLSNIQVNRHSRFKTRTSNSGVSKTSIASDVSTFSNINGIFKPEKVRRLRSYSLNNINGNLDDETRSDISLSYGKIDGVLPWFPRKSFSSNIRKSLGSI